MTPSEIRALEEWISTALDVARNLHWATDEVQNAELLEMMRRPLLVSDWPGCEGWRVDIGVEPLTPLKGFPNAVGGRPLGPTNLDRKLAVCLAWRVWWESLSEEKRASCLK
jgi:hypothetical protein